MMTGKEAAEAIGALLGLAPKIALYVYLFYVIHHFAEKFW